ncbi:MAG: hypothetical protein IJZ89_00620 [Clostridia bacterium]|nr:hypothetical protein [Clostridia bacterium]
MYTREQVLSVLDKVYNDSRMIMLGEQCNGGRDMPAKMLERYANATGGKYPAVMGIDLACYGLKLPELEIGGEIWNTIIDQLTDYAEKGGIITASSHFANPTGEYGPGGLCRGKFGGNEMWEEMLTEGTELNKIIKEELIIDGKFLKALDDKGIPVLWRPLHEANGAWFWFCARSHSEMDWIDPEYLRRFWRYIYDLYVNEMGIKNLIWVYGPNVSQSAPGGTRDVLYYYPGDEYCDMVGVDWYSGNKNEVNYPGHSYDKIMSLGKPCALTEFGPSGPLKAPNGSGVAVQEKLFNAVDMVELMKSLKRQGLKISYVLTWCGGCGAIYSIGRGEEALADPFCVDLERLKTLYE